MHFNAQQPFLLFASVPLCLLAFETSAIAEQAPRLVPDEEGMLFSIGIEDGSRAEYQGYGWGEVDVFSCTAGLDCHVLPFPSHLHAPSARNTWATSAVVLSRITFAVEDSYENLALRLVRAGAETISVRLDEGEPILVTKMMMDPPTYEHSDFGASEVNLGTVEAGTHQLELSIAEDGEGNGRFGWDAIILKLPME